MLPVIVYTSFIFQKLLFRVRDKDLGRDHRSNAATGGY